MKQGPARYSVLYDGTSKHRLVAGKVANALASGVFKGKRARHLPRAPP